MTGTICLNLSGLRCINYVKMKWKVSFHFCHFHPKIVNNDLMIKDKRRSWGESGREDWERRRRRRRGGMGGARSEL